MTIDFCGRPVAINARARLHFEALEDIFLAHPYGQSIDDIADDWGYACRKIGGASTWSNHAWGIALDINATRNAMGSGQRGDIPMVLVERAEAIGFRWGGRYSTPDPMHFETLLTPQEIRDRFPIRKEWDEMASKEEIKQVVRAVVRDEMTRQRKLLAVGKTQKSYNPDNVNIKVAITGGKR